MNGFKHMQALSKLIVCGVFISSVQAAQAACTLPEQTLFACTTAKNKAVAVCDLGDTISYTYGKTGRKPELSLLLERKRVSTTQWQGIGRYENYAIYIPNGQTVYTLSHSRDKLKNNATLEAGILVETAGKQVASLACLSKGLVANLHGVNLSNAP